MDYREYELSEIVSGYETQERQRGLALPRNKTSEPEGTFHRTAAIDGVLRIGSFVASKKNSILLSSRPTMREYFRQQYIGSWIFSGGAWLGISAVMFGMILYRSHAERIRREAKINLAASVRNFS